ncbi:MAG TPA: hypothetical protein VIB39_11550 [Candidatus Angelobacter sp.]|jgi:hypothetical protein
MANVRARRSGNEGSLFGWFMLAIVVFVVLLLWYFEARQGSLQIPSPRAGLLHTI